MFHRFQNSRYTTRRTTVSGKGGFTLIETLLAIGLLVILTLVISQGVVSTMQLSKNTAIFEKSGDLAAGQVNVVLASVTGNPANNPVAAIHLEASGYTKNLGVFTYDVAGTPNTNFGKDAYKETNYISTNRSGFYYCGKALTS